MHRFAFRSLAALALLALASPALAGIADLKGTQPGDLAFDGFQDADNCTICHSSPGPDPYMPMDTWAGTMMGNAARDPVFFAALTVANQDVPGVGTYCLRCHSPIGFVRGHATPPDGSAFDKIDRQGVGCETCHRAEQTPPPDGPYYLSDAQLVYSEQTSKHGPYADSTSPAHESLQDLGLEDARFCGQCHQVTNPEKHLLDAQGNDTGLEFPLDTTYTEWAASAYAPGGASPAGCIDCHMPKKMGMLPVSAVPGSPTRPDPREHAFVGGNHWGVLAVAQANPDRYSKYKAEFDFAAQRTLDNLAKSVKVTLESAPSSAMPGAAIDVKVKVENLTGHKFPTGYAESRRAWIAIALLGDGGAETTLLGAYDAATGEIAASPATHVYRAQQGHWNGMAGEPDDHLATHDVILEDTRIPPLGFVAGPTTTPLGPIDYADGNGGYRSYDEATFTVTIPDGAYGAQKLAARVYYQSMTRAYVDALAQANTTDDTGTKLKATYDATEQAPPILVAEAAAPIDLGPAPTTSGTGAGGAGGASTATSAGGAGDSTSSAGGAAAGPASPGDDGGCGCRVGEGGEGMPASAAALTVLGLVVLRRRRGPRRSGG